MTSSIPSTPSLQPGDRIQHHENLGTLRYLGKLPNRGDTIWAGIEWDEPNRGKHSGEYNGQNYFHCTIPNSGTFLKLSKLSPNGFRKSFLTSLHKRYILDAQDESFRRSDLSLGGVPVHIISDKHHQSLTHLIRVDLTAQGIAFLDPIPNIQQTLPQLRELVLGRSLFQGTEFVFTLLQALPGLHVLDLSRNVLLPRVDRYSLQETTLPLRQLILNACTLDWNVVMDLCTVASSVNELRLHACALGAMNDSEEWRTCIRHALSCVKVLDLDQNNVKWKDVVQVIGKLPQLKELYISRNELYDHDAPAMENGVYEEHVFEKLEVLSIAENNLEGWRFVTWLGILPTLHHLRIRGNKITPTTEERIIGGMGWLVRVIGRVGTLVSVDGSAVTKDERLLCERRYALEECIQDAIKLREKDNKDWMELFWKMHPRAKRLWKDLGVFITESGEVVNEAIGTGVKTEKNTIGSNSVWVRIVVGKGLLAKKKEIRKRMPLSTSVSVLTKASRRLLKIDGEQMDMGLQVDGRKIENENERITDWVTWRVGQDSGNDSKQNEVVVVLFSKPV